MVSTDAAVTLGERDQLGVHGLHVGHVLVAQVQVDAMVLLEDGEHVQAAPAPTPAGGIAVVGDVLQLPEHEPGHDERARQEPGGDHVHQATVDDGAGVHVGRRPGSARRP